MIYRLYITATITSLAVGVASARSHHVGIAAATITAARSCAAVAAAKPDAAEHTGDGAATARHAHCRHPCHRDTLAAATVASTPLLLTPRTPQPLPAHLH